ncbi:aromatic-ring-hydroxylating dioxygenase subunit beta, partial [Mycobacterium intracellulare]|uniref:aromatic-ring-hydroxylating dioxygenase subunit beta n=1 Tax=Mycobacterium intracellulare TaxID=1767 RepID=UPI0027E469D6
VTAARGAGFDASPFPEPGMAHFDEDKYSLTQRVARMGTEHVWAEDPPSRLRNSSSADSTTTSSESSHSKVRTLVMKCRSR